MTNDPPMFESGRAKRERLIVSCAIVGWPNSGKTLSSIRLATGMLRARPGKIVVVDSNLRRSLYYADDYEFDVVHLTAPFSSERWRAAYQQALDMGATIIIGDCMSDEHEGEGGVLDAKERLLDEIVERRLRRMKPDERENADIENLRERNADIAWREVKRGHLDLRLWMMQQRVDWILTYRAKQKIDRKNKREELGWQPVGAADIIADLTFKCLLPPMSDGKPDWKPNLPAEKLLVKNPQHMREMLTKYPQLNEDLGELIARWANGGEQSPARAVPPTAAPAAAPASTTKTFADRYDDAGTPEEATRIGKELRRAWPSMALEAKDAAVAAERRAVDRFKRQSTRAGAGDISADISAEERAQIERNEAERHRRESE